MTDKEKRKQNRARCLKCKYYSRNSDVFKIDKCILDYEVIKNIPADSLEEFIFYKYPVFYLQYIGKVQHLEKNQPLEIGDKVITLRGGFGSCYGGVFLTVTGRSDYEYYLMKENDDEHKYCVSLNTWYMDVFKLET